MCPARRSEQMVLSSMRILSGNTDLVKGTKAAVSMPLHACGTPFLKR